MKTKIFLSAVTLILSANLSHARVGSSGWTVMRRARSAKFKPVTTTPVMAVRGDLSGVFYNPGLLGLNPAMELFLLSELGITDDKYVGAVYGHPVRTGSWAVGILYYDGGSIELNWMDGGSVESETVKAQRDILALASYGHRLNPRLSVGLTLKIASSELFERASATAFAADIGAVYAPGIENLSLGAAVQNIGTSTEFISRADPLPSAAHIGAVYWVDIGDYYITPGIDITYLKGEERIAPEIGFEAGTGPISINLGHRINVTEASWHFGITWLQEKYDIAYSFLPGINLNPTHRVSIGYRFGWYEE